MVFISLSEEKRKHKTSFSVEMITNDWIIWMSVGQFVKTSTEGLDEKLICKLKFLSYVSLIILFSNFIYKVVHYPFYAVLTQASNNNVHMTIRINNFIALKNIGVT